MPIVIFLLLVVCKAHAAAPELVWKVWYDDNSDKGLQVFHSATNVWTDIPDRPGVQVVLICEAKEWAPGRPYRAFIKAGDWYWIENGRPRKSFGDGAPNGTWSPRPNKNARAGVTIDDDVFNRYHSEALEDATCAQP